ncbi:hypothetical protein D3C76_1348250 [compost metagenome]
MTFVLPRMDSITILPLPEHGMDNTELLTPPWIWWYPRLSISSSQPISFSFLKTAKPEYCIWVGVSIAAIFFFVWPVLGSPKIRRPVRTGCFPSLVKSLISSSSVIDSVGDQLFSEVSRDANSLLAGSGSSGVMIFSISNALVPLVTTR